MTVISKLVEEELIMWDHYIEEEGEELDCKENRRDFLKRLRSDYNNYYYDSSNRFFKTSTCIICKEVLYENQREKHFELHKEESKLFYINRKLNKVLDQRERGIIGHKEIKESNLKLMASIKEYKESLLKLSILNKSKEKKQIEEVSSDLIPLKEEIIQLNKKKGFSLQYFYENMLASTLGRIPDFEWFGDELKDKVKYQQVIENMEKRKQLIILFYQSKEWKRKRAEILKRDKHKCYHCGAIATEVHHINSAIYNPEMCLDPENLMSVCNRCHPKKRSGRD